MLPKFLQSNYKRYKTDTEISISWVAMQGEKCGVRDTTRTANKDGKDNKAGLRQLKAWAEAIAKSGVKVPSSVLAAGRRAVSLRTRCNDWFQGEVDTASVLSNSFSALEVEDYDTDGGIEPTPVLTRSSSAASSVSVFELDELEEKMFATFCLFDDLQKIRDFLAQTWKDYAANTIDLMAASVTTNTALDLAREQCGEFFMRYPDLDGSGSVARQA